MFCEQEQFLVYWLDDAVVSEGNTPEEVTVLREEVRLFFVDEFDLDLVLGVIDDNGNLDVHVNQEFWVFNQVGTDPYRTENIRARIEENETTTTEDPADDDSDV